MNQHLADLAAEYWEYRLSTSPSTAHLLGDHRYDDQVEDQSRAAEDDHIGELRRYVSAANALDAGELSADEQITRDTLVFEAGTLADLIDLRKTIVEPTVEDPFPCAQVKAATRHRNDSLTAHDQQREADAFLASHGVSVVLSFLSRQASPVRLCNRPLGRHWLVGAWGASSSKHLS